MNWWFGDEKEENVEKTNLEKYLKAGETKAFNELSVLNLLTTI